MKRTTTGIIGWAVMSIIGACIGFGYLEAPSYNKLVGYVWMLAGIVWAIDFSEPKK